MAEKLVLPLTGAAGDGQTHSAHIAGWAPGGHRRDTGCLLDFAPVISWTWSLCKDAGAGLGMLHTGSAASKLRRTSPLPWVLPHCRPHCSETHRGYCSSPRGLGASRLTPGGSSFSIYSDPAQQFRCC